MQSHLAVIFNILLLTQFDYNSAKITTDLYEKEYVIEDVVKVNFFEALRMCLNRDMRLATITSKEDDDKLKALITKSLVHPNQEYKYWTSGSDLGNEGIFYWLSSGKPVIYHNWMSPNPDNCVYDGESENCLQLWNDYGNTRYSWNDATCSQKNYYICERFNEILN